MGADITGTTILKLTEESQESSLLQTVIIYMLLENSNRFVSTYSQGSYHYGKAKKKEALFHVSLLITNCRFQLEIKCKRKSCILHKFELHAPRPPKYTVQER